MASWRKCILGDLFEVKHGYAFKGEFFSDEGLFVLLTPGNFREEGGLKLKGEKEKFYTGEFPDEFKLRRGDLLVAMTDLTQNAPILGSPAFIPEDNRYLHNQRLGKIVNLKTDEIAPEFLFYLMNTPSVRGQIKGSASGATVRHTSPSRIYEITVELPQLPEQQQIAGVLSAYDELIENSQRRIRILETMARALYREWFVNFRFPGHEKHPCIASPIGNIPKGWEIRPLFELATVKYGKNLPTKKLADDGAYPVYGAAKIIGRYTEYTREQRTIICGCRGSVGEMQITQPQCYVTNNSFTFDPTHPDNFFWLFQALKERGLRDVVGGAAQPQITLEGISSVELVTPPLPLRTHFQQTVSAMFEQAWTLDDQIRNLRRTRDLLLPRLLSGQIDLLAA